MKVETEGRTDVSPDAVVLFALGPFFHSDDHITWAVSKKKNQLVSASASK